jgi:hypothetical protein
MIVKVDDRLILGKLMVEVSCRFVSQQEIIVDKMS